MTILAGAIVAVVTLVVLGILFPQYSVAGFTHSAHVAKTQVDLAAIRDAIDQFNTDCGRYPTSSEGVKALMISPPGEKNWKGPYLPREISPDPWGNRYMYLSHGRNGHEGYLIESYGADGMPGGTGENADIIDGTD